jgi:hypothetical protein
LSPAREIRDLTLVRAAILASAFGLLSATAACASSPLAPGFSPPEELLLAQRAIADSSAASSRAVQPMPPEIGRIASPEEAVIGGHKKLGLGVLYSLILPGAGHLYAGSKRGWINIGADLLSWAAYLHYRDLGKSKEDEFESYADAHWDRDRWYKTGTDSGGTCVECNHGTDEDQLLDKFYATNRQQYYEDIGKITTYFGGWDDYVSDPGVEPQYSSANRRFYKGIRDHSNNFLKNSDYGLATALVNRVVSAVDVFRMLKRRTLPMLGGGTNLRIHVRTRPFASETRFGFELSKRL